MIFVDIYVRDIQQPLPWCDVNRTLCRPIMTVVLFVISLDSALHAVAHLTSEVNY